MTEPDKGQRIDKWLWHARFVKTRSLAQKLIANGKLRIDRERVTNTSRLVRPGNVLTITLARQVRIIEIGKLSVRRGPYSEAQELYTDLSPPLLQTKEKNGPLETAPGINGSGRPDKYQRRQILKMKRNSTQQDS